MKKLRILIKPVAILLAVAVLFTSCASTTTIESFPSGANVYLNGEAVGQTPYKMKDQKVSGSTTLVRLEKEGYTTTNTSICKNEKAHVGAIIGGCLLLFPFIWTLQYKADHYYNLEPLAEAESAETADGGVTLTKAERLVELSELHKKGILTKREYQEEKKKILQEQ